MRWRIVGGLPLVGREDAQTAKTMDLQDTKNVAAVEEEEVAAVGSTIVVPVAAPIARTTDLRGTNNVAAVVVPAVDQQEPRATGIAVVEHAGENGKDLAQIQAASSLGALLNACLIMRLLVLSAIRQVRPSSLLQRREIPSGRVVLVAANVSCSLLLRAGR